MGEKGVGKLSRETPPPREGEPMGAKRRKLKWYGHVTQSSGLDKTILIQGTVQGGRRRGRQRK